MPCRSHHKVDGSVSYFSIAATPFHPPPLSPYFPTFPPSPLLSVCTIAYHKKGPTTHGVWKGAGNTPPLTLLLPTHPLPSSYQSVLDHSDLSIYLSFPLARPIIFHSILPFGNRTTLKVIVTHQFLFLPFHTRWFDVSPLSLLPVCRC